MTLGTELEQGGVLQVSGVAVLKAADDATPTTGVGGPAQPRPVETAAAALPLVAPYLRPDGEVPVIDPSDGGRNDR